MIEGRQDPVVAIMMVLMENTIKLSELKLKLGGWVVEVC